MAMKVWKPIVVFAAEGAGIGQGGRRDQFAKFRPFAKLVDQRGQDALDVRLLHQRDERLQLAERERLRASSAKAGESPKSTANE